jgi:hypothetical protein
MKMRVIFTAVSLRPEVDLQFLAAGANFTTFGVHLKGVRCADRMLF